MTMPLELRREQVQSFRARRGHLAGPGASGPEEAARAVVGIQAQVESAALWALALRTQGWPSVSALRRALLEERTLVRTWAQRDTVHIFDVEDWPAVAAADSLWPSSARKGAEPPESALAATLSRFDGRPLTRSDVLDLPTTAMIEDMAVRVRSEDEAPRYAAGRLFWRLAHRGQVCFGPTVAGEQAYVARRDWLPSLPEWTGSAEDAALSLVRRYLAVNGPATAKDVAHYFGARVTAVRAWLQRLDDALVDVRCEDREGLVALAEDADDLRADSTPAPPRLLASYDTLLMAHADKTWTTPEASDKKKVWRPSAVVAAVVLAEGRAVALWRQRKTKRAVHITVTPLSGWKRTLLKRLKSDAEGLAAHLELESVDIVEAA